MYIVLENIALKAAEEPEFQSIMELLRRENSIAEISRLGCSASVTCMDELFQAAGGGELRFGRVMTVWNEDEGTLVGLLVLEKMDWKNGVAEIAVFPAEGREADVAKGLKALLRFCFDELRTECAVVTCLAEDAPVGRTCEAAGFLRDVVLRARIQVGDQNKDVAVYTYTQAEREHEKANV